MTSDSNLNTSNWVPLEGAMNVRDIGGWITRDDHRIRIGALYRGDRLCNLTEDDLDELADRGIRTVIDFRASDEIERDPSRLWNSVNNVVSLPVQERNVQPTALLDRILARQITSMNEAEMVEVYLHLLHDNAIQFARFVALVADTDNWPLLYHCTAGKDRTGIATALVHEICAVPRPQVLDEYCVTNEQRSKQRIAELAEIFEREGIDLEAVKPLLMAPRSVLADALKQLDDVHSGAESFLITQGGLDPSVPDELRNNLVI